MKPAGKHPGWRSSDRRGSGGRLRRAPLMPDFAQASGESAHIIIARGFSGGFPNARPRLPQEPALQEQPRQVLG